MSSFKLEQREVFEELGLSRKAIKKVECTQKPLTVDVSVPGEVPDENVISIIEMLRPSVKQLRTYKSINCQEDPAKQGFSERKLKETTVDRCKKMADLTYNRKEEPSEESKEEGLSKKMINSNLCKDEEFAENTVSGLPPGELPDDAVSSIIDMLRPTIRQSSPNKSGIVNGRDAENPKCTEDERSACNNDSMRKPTEILPGQGISLESPLTLQSDPFRDSAGKMVPGPSAPLQLNKTGKNDNSTITEKDFATMASNTETFKRRRRRHRSRKKKPEQFTDRSTASTSSPCLINSEQINNFINKEIQVDGDDKGLMLPEEHRERMCDLQSDEVLMQQIVVDNLTILRNKTIWTDSPFYVPVDSENSEETNCKLDSEPTQGPTDMMQHKIHFNNPEQDSSITKEVTKHFEAPLRVKNECQYDYEPSMFKTMNTVTDSNKKSEEDKSGGVGFIKTSLSTMGRSFSETSSVSSLSNSYFDKKRPPSYCHNIDFGHPSSSGKLREFWAITKINVYPDDSRTYEVMPVTGKKPPELPENSDSVFVIIPPKKEPYAPCNL